MALKAGTKADYGGSMAEAIENSFKEAWPTLMGDLPMPEGNDQSKLIFIAVAQGVVKHLVAHPEAFKITVNFSDLDHIGKVVIEGS
jgi:hypothetical protein